MAGRKGLERRIALIVPHFLSAPFIVARTDMLLSLPERIAQKFLDLAPLSILSAPIDLPAYDLVMVWHPLRENDPVIAGCAVRYSPFAKRLTRPPLRRSPTRQAGGESFDLDQKVGRLGQRFAAIQDSRAVKLINHGIELAFRPKARESTHASSGLCASRNSFDPLDDANSVRFESPR